MTIFVAKKIMETSKNVQELGEYTLFSRNTKFRFREISCFAFAKFREICQQNFAKYESGFNEILQNFAFAKFHEHQIGRAHV